MIYHCVEAPCAWQNPTPILKPLPNEEYKCPFCEGVYSKSLLIKIYGKCGKLPDDCHLECCGEACEGDHCENCGPDV